jgi:hypothetical protein
VSNCQAQTIGRYQRDTSQAVQKDCEGRDIWPRTLALSAIAAVNERWHKNDNEATDGIADASSDTPSMESQRNQMSGRGEARN